MSSNAEKNNKKSNNLDKINPVDFIFKTMASRDPKKRKVKPISKSYDLLASDLLNDTSSDDEDYKPKEIDEDDDGDGDDDDDDDDEEDEDDDDADEDGDDESDANQNGTDHPEDNLTNDLHNGVESSFVKFDLPSKVTKLLVCSVCLGDVSHEYDEIVECDSCGITVHENCYGVTNDTEVDNESVHSNASSSSTEPWFCDSCLANVSSPSCDLCPNTGGIFKQTDVKRWVHLVCALYIPGVAFSDTTHLVGVTLFELPYFKWGSRVCSLCEDERLSRTGICISCDAGMCKSYFHVTCAQSHGLLSEAQNSEETELVDPFYAHCKVHASDKSGVKSKRRNWLALQSHIKIRKQQQGSSISERIAKKLNKARVNWLSREDLRSPSWVPNQKAPRLLITSSSAVKKLIKKAELLGLSPQAQIIASHDVIDIRKKWHIAPAFSVEFITYYLDRNNRMITMKKKYEELKVQYQQLKSHESTTTSKYEELLTQFNHLKEENSKIRTDCRNIWSLLGSFTKEKLNYPKIIEINESEKEKREESESGVETGQDSSAPRTPPSVIIKCGICHKSHDYQKLALCDSCKLHYHLYCLDPPLTRMPKKTRFGGWQCSECTEKEDEELHSLSEEEAKEESSDEVGTRKRRLREHVKGPNKFIPDADTSQPGLAPAKRKRQAARRRSKNVAKKSTKLEHNLDEESQSFDGSGRRSSSAIDSPLVNYTPTINIEPLKKVVKTEEECCKCKTVSSLRQLVQCDECQLYYHFGCLNPPVKKNPKPRGYQWYCEECDESEEEDFEEEEDELADAEETEERGKEEKVSLDRKEEINVEIKEEVRIKEEVVEMSIKEENLENNENLKHLDNVKPSNQMPINHEMS